MIKQQLLSHLYAIGGSPEEVKDKMWSLYNHNYLFRNRPYEEPLDIGNPAVFNYFLINKENYLKGRTSAFCMVLADTNKYKNNGQKCFWDAKKMAAREWEQMESIRFLQNNDRVLVNDTYTLHQSSHETNVE